MLSDSLQITPGMQSGPPLTAELAACRFLKGLPQGVDEINNICLAQSHGPVQDVETVRRIVQVSFYHTLLLRMHALHLARDGCLAMIICASNAEC